MSVENNLKERSSNVCELCKATNNLKVYEVPPVAYITDDKCIFICAKCIAQLDKTEALDEVHWKCLSETMWSELPVLQIISWRMLNRLRKASWAQENLDMMYLDDENLAWAKKMGDDENDGEAELHVDSNGHQLLDGDSVVLIKSLDVKGSTLNAKMGTVVKNIHLVKDNKEQIEGRVEGQMIVILTKYLRKQGVGTT
jgi:protein PhnA